MSSLNRQLIYKAVTYWALMKQLHVTTGNVNQKTRDLDVYQSCFFLQHIFLNTVIWALTKRKEEKPMRLTPDSQFLPCIHLDKIFIVSARGHLDLLLLIKLVVFSKKVGSGFARQMGCTIMIVDT